MKPLYKKYIPMEYDKYHLTQILGHNIVLSKENKLHGVYLLKMAQYKKFTVFKIYKPITI